MPSTARRANCDLSQEVHRLEWEETAGELGALLREGELIKTRLPAHNIALRRKLNQVMLQFDDKGRPRYLRADSMSLDAFGSVYGPFGSRASARRLLTSLAGEHGLCMKVLQLEGRHRNGDGTPCFNHQLHRCRGACIGTEPLADHARRLHELLAPWLIPPWPYDGPVALIERNAARQREQIHVFDRWCWLGTVSTFEAAEALARTAPRRFEADAARLALQAVEGRLAVECLAVVAPQPAAVTEAA